MPDRRCAGWRRRSCGRALRAVTPWRDRRGMGHEVVERRGGHPRAAPYSISPTWLSYRFLPRKTMTVSNEARRNKAQHGKAERGILEVDLLRFALA